MLKPNINVTPLIDVLLVLLIIFMIVTPSRPTRFEARVPQAPKTAADLSPNPHALIVTVNSDRSIKLNRHDNIATVEDPEKLIASLRAEFQRRREHIVYIENAGQSGDLSEEGRILKTVFIKAPRSLEYGTVVRVVDAVKMAGASPVGLQIDDLQ